MKLDNDRLTGRRWVMRGRDWGDASPSQRKPRTAGNHQKLEEAGLDSSLEPRGGAWLADTLALEF